MGPHKPQRASRKETDCATPRTARSSPRTSARPARGGCGLSPHLRDRPRTRAAETSGEARLPHALLPSAPCPPHPVLRPIALRKSGRKTQATPCAGPGPGRLQVHTADVHPGPADRVRTATSTRPRPAVRPESRRLACYDSDRPLSAAGLTVLQGAPGLAVVFAPLRPAEGRGLMLEESRPVWGRGVWAGRAGRRRCSCRLKPACVWPSRSWAVGDLALPGRGGSSRRWPRPVGRAALLWLPGGAFAAASRPLVPPRARLPSPVAVVGGLPTLLPTATNPGLSRAVPMWTRSVLPPCDRARAAWACRRCARPSEDASAERD